ncbi:hypothetical protein JQN72_01425 [Phycicoccus sp. CSK15P-2]|uniref:hypothetical protein n=1 Tax=Phycicoccus sp. CSK15P-2 TaxID=2807627 RepID=UPI0019514A3B|nr:hypothetical protein [Phycicoccus sp. CSK15P-2]MBM6402907.1 hypothetical protein [Phycicoccus sp. CSK15P-2]
MKKIQAAAVAALVTSVVRQVREYARDNPEQAAKAVDAAEAFLRERVPAERMRYVTKGMAGLRSGLGLPQRPAGSALADPDPDTDEPWAPHDPHAATAVAPNPTPGTGDDPQPRRGAGDPFPMTPGE